MYEQATLKNPQSTHENQGIAPYAEGCESTYVFPPQSSAALGADNVGHEMESWEHGDNGGVSFRTMPFSEYFFLCQMLAAANI